MRVLLNVLAVALLLVVVGLVGVWWLGGPDVHRWVAHRALELALGDNVRVDGTLEVELGMEPLLQLTGLRIDSPSWAEAPAQLQIERAQIRIALRPLLRRMLVFRLVDLEGVTIALETAADGRHSWQPDGAPAGTPGLATPLFDRLSVRDATILYRDQREDLRTRLHLASLTLRPDDASGGIRLDAHGDVDGQALRIEGTSGDLEVALAATAPYPLDIEIQLPSTEVRLTGTIGDVARTWGMDLRLDARSSSLRAVTRLWNVSIPADAGITVGARLEGDLEVLSLADVDAEISGSGGDRLKLAGSLGNVWAGTGLDGRFELKLDPAGPGGKLLPVDWRILNQIEATGSIAGSVATVAFEDLSAEIGGPGDSSLSLAGSLAVATPGGVRIERFDLTSRLEVMRTAELAALLGIDGAGLERLWFEGKLSGDERQLDADGQATLGETRFDGVLSGDLRSARPRFKGHLHSPLVRLSDLGLVPAASRDPAPADQGTASAGSYLFGRDPFPLDGLQKLDLDLEVRFDSLEGIALAVGRARAHVMLSEGKLQLSGVRFEVVEGYAELDAEVDTRQATPTWRLQATTDDLDLGDVWRQLQTDVPIGGDLDLMLDLKAVGKSPRDLASSLSGDLSLALQRGQIRSRLFDLTALNPIRWLAARSTRRGYAAIDCLVARFQADRGVAEVLALVLDTPNVIAAGEGYIDFARETLDLRVRPRAKQRSVIPLATPFAIRGSLADPALAYSTTGATARTLGRVFASPVNLLGALLPFVNDRDRDRDNPCLTLSDPDAGAP